MELRHLRYFITVVEHKSIRLASHYLHVTQPAISRQIQDLETEVGVKLTDWKFKKATAPNELWLYILKIQ